MALADGTNRMEPILGAARERFEYNNWIGL
jgi:hypothetical protein